MIYKHIITSTIVFFSALSTCLAAENAYRWVDENGVTNFSDTPPVTESPTETNVIPFSIPDNYTTAIRPENDYYSIDKQWQRLHDERLKRDKIILEKQRVQLERSRINSRSEPEPIPVYNEPYIYDRVPTITRPFFHDYQPYHDKPHQHKKQRSGHKKYLDEPKRGRLSIKSAN